MVLPIALLTIGSIFIIAGFTGRTISQVVNGEPPSPDNEAPPVATASSGSSGSSSQVEQIANRMIAFRHPYKWGGGHQGFDPDGPWDCSGAVSYLVHALGIPISAPMVSGQFMTVGKPGRGKVFTIYANPTHVFIVMETGPYKGKSWGTTRRIASEGGSLKWHDHTKVGFVARHYEGW